MTRAVLALTAILVGFTATSASAQATVVPDPSAWGFGPAIGFISNNLGSDLVNPGDAFIDETGIVRVTKVTNSEPMLLFGVHHVLGRIKDKVGVGPGIVVKPGDNLIDAAGAGLVFEFRDPNDAAGFTLGVGAILRFATTRLADGWKSGELAPTSNIEYLEKDELFLGFWTGISY